MRQSTLAAPSHPRFSGNAPAPLSPEDKLAQLEREAAAIREAIAATRTKHADLLAKLPAMFEVASLADVVSIIHGGVATAGTTAAPNGSSRHKRANGHSRRSGGERTARGTKRTRAHISDWKRAQIIRAVFGNRKTVLQIAAKYGVSPQAVYAIKGKELERMTRPDAPAAAPTQANPTA